ncbi:hypothetical protein BFF78_24215 [Streptomyces fodineus]|uniref:PknH-like extracellular domain-containing protein n=1 Tax=Streptomyces fodineus TaxID=1904616 RepID=A0A1D7YDR7_9ACTN|nr:hypothetical protein [Streptomyces fodineus]AOR33753.1 hypothetical protein BFF78_24215 [Streptomyces fodineus]
MAAILSGLLLGGCSAKATSSTGHPGPDAQPTSAKPAAAPAGSGMPALTTAQLIQRLLPPDELGVGYKTFGTEQTGADQPPGFRTLKPGSVACTDAMASFAMNPRVGRLSAKQFATRTLGNPTTGAGLNEWVGSFSSPAQAEQAVNNLLRDAAACPTGTITSPTPAATFTLTRLPAPRYGDQSAELLSGGDGNTVADPVFIVRYGANLMALTIDTRHNRDALVSAAAKAANKRFIS